MNHSSNAQRHFRWTLLGLLGVLVLLSLVMTSSRLYSASDAYLDGIQIDLHETRPEGEPEPGAEEEPLPEDDNAREPADAQTEELEELPADPPHVSYDTDLEVTEEETGSMVVEQVEIFRVHYTGAGDEITVSGSGDYVLAPGVENQCTFVLNNTGRIGLDYTVELESYFENESYTIPVQVKLTDWQGTFCLGDEGSWADVLELNQVEESGNIAAGGRTYYTLEWEWAFEGDDELDTTLGNAAVGEDIALTILLRITATADGTGTSTTVNPGSPRTADDSNSLLWGALGVLAGLAFLILLVLHRRWESEDRSHDDRQD